MNRSLIRI